MLSAASRIKNKKDFDLIFKKGKTFKKGFLILKVYKNGLDKSRFGFVASLKVSKKAVVRNKIRRRISEIIRIKLKDIKTGFDFVFVVLPGIEKQKFQEIKEDINHILANV
jgi:ribonuclease P protein component